MDYLLTFIAGAIFGAGFVLVLNKFRRKDDEWAKKARERL